MAAFAAIFFVPMMMKVLILSSFFIWCISCQQVLDQNSKISIDNQGQTEQLKNDTTFRLIWHFKEAFSKTEQALLKKWVSQVHEATMETLGQYQFDVHYYFYRSKGQEPVPFAHTSRGNNEMAVHFYVNTNYPLADFLADWTAPHEISHLSIPAVGKQNKWFSEGYATFLSRQVMMTMGYYTLESSNTYNLDKISAQLNAFVDDDRSMLVQIDSLFQAHQYPAAYWGGCTYFYTIDQTLRKNYQSSLMAIVQRYQTTFRLKDLGLMPVIHSFDHILDDSLFLMTYHAYKSQSALKILNQFQ